MQRKTWNVMQNRIGRLGLRSPAICFGWLAILALAATGCHHKAQIESNRTAVKGSVTLDGKPLPCGRISFLLADNPMYRVSVMIRGDGSFSVADAPKGRVNVTIETESAKGNNPKYVPIPKRYGDVKTSKLTADIAPDGNTSLLFELKSDG